MTSTPPISDLIAFPYLGWKKGGLPTWIFLGLLFGALFTGCTERPSQVGTETLAPPDCQDAVELLLDKKFTNWQGWPPDCDIPQLEKEGLIQRDSGMYFSGEDVQRAYWRMLNQEVYESGVMVWFIGDTLLKLQVEFPDLKETPQELSKDWGEPVKEDYYMGVLLVEDGEWVFAERGISLRVSFEASMVYELILFKPTTHEIYMRDIYFSEQEREHPIDWG